MSLFSLAGPPSLAPQVLSTQRRLADCPLSFSVLYVSLAHASYVFTEPKSTLCYICAYIKRYNASYLQVYWCTRHECTGSAGPHCKNEFVALTVNFTCEMHAGILHAWCSILHAWCSCNMAASTYNYNYLTLPCLTTLMQSCMYMYVITIATDM